MARGIIQYTSSTIQRKGGMVQKSRRGQKCRQDLESRVHERGQSISVGMARAGAEALERCLWGLGS